MPGDLNVPTELMRLLMEAGYVACGRGLREKAEAIFNGVSVARPTSELPLIGLAVTKINFGIYADASKILIDRALKLNPESGLAKAFLAIAFKELGDMEQATGLMNDIIANSDDPAAVNLAKSFIAGKDTV